MKAIATTEAPAAIGPYSQAITTGNLIFLSGQIALDPAKKTMISEEPGFAERANAAKGGAVALETEQVMKNLEAVLRAAGASFKCVARTTIYLSSMADFPIVNEIYGRYFEGITPPARATVQVAGLPRGALVEIDAVAVMDHLV